MLNLDFRTLFVSLFFSYLPSLLLACNRLDHESLLSFSLHLKIENSHLLDWPSSQNCCSWEGIRCNNLATQVTQISLPLRGLSGEISPFLGNLTHLSYLNLSHNSLSGPLPKEIFSLRFLETLDLSYNSFSGVLSPFLRLKFIKMFDLSNNELNGEIPFLFFQLAEGLASFNVSNNNFTGLLPSSSICNNNVLSSSVMFLDFSHNEFEGNIPLGFGKCQNLKVLIASHNALTGPIPTDLYNITSLQVLCLHVNRLSGTLSPRLTQLENLYYIELRNNMLTGSIPSDIGRLWKLKSLLLQSNRLTGLLPSSLMNCTNLVALILRINNLEGNLSSFDFSRFSQLRLLDLGNNYFTGVIPPSIYACKSLQAIRFSGNLLEGQISQEIRTLNSLRLLALTNNNLKNITGAIRVLSACKNLTTLLLCQNFINEALPNDEQTSPDGFGVLRTLALCGSNLTGQVPEWLRNIKRLSFLDISGNKLTGSIPGWLGNLPELFYLNISANSLSGKISEGLFNMQALRFREISLDLPIFLMPNCVVSWQYNSLANIKPSLFLSGNRLTGKIPTEVGQLKFLHILELSRNEFSGEIPQQISQLTRLETLDVSRNNLSGEIPSSLTKLSFLSRFSVADNNLHGLVPSGGQFETFPSSSFEGNPGLCGLILHRKCSEDYIRTRQTDEHDDSFKILKSSELRFGIISGAVFGFISCFIVGMVLSPRKGKPRGKIGRKEKTCSENNRLFGGKKNISRTGSSGFSGWTSSNPKIIRNSESY